VEPRVFKHAIGEDTFLGVTVEHGQHEALEELCFGLCEAVLGDHHVLKAPVLKLGDADQVAFF
jgi:hypothetical protein